MRIIFLEAAQDLGGARKSTLELAKRMQSLGHQVLIVDFWGCSLPFINKIKAFNLEYQLLDPRSEPYIISDKYKFKRFVKGIKYFFLQNRYRDTFQAIVNRFQPEIVNVNNWKCLNILKPDSRYKIDYFARGWFDYKNLPVTCKIMLRRYKPRMIAVSQSTRQAVYTGGIAELSDIKVLTDVIDEEVVNNYRPAYCEFNSVNPIKVLHSGGFLYTKGQHICVEIAKGLKERGLNFRMTLTGIIYKGGSSEEYYKSIVNLIEEYELSGCVNIVLNKSNVIEYFKATDILIHPSWTEGLPRVCLEALSFGKPIIANPVGGVTDVVIHGLTGFLTDFNYIEQYVNYINEYYVDSECYKKHSQSAIQLIRQSYLEKHQERAIKNIYPI